MNARLAACKASHARRLPAPPAEGLQYCPRAEQHSVWTLGKHARYHLFWSPASGAPKAPAGLHFLAPPRQRPRNRQWRTNRDAIPCGVTPAPASHGIDTSAYMTSGGAKKLATGYDLVGCARLSTEPRSGSGRGTVVPVMVESGAGPSRRGSAAGLPEAAIRHLCG